MKGNNTTNTNYGIYRSGSNSSTKKSLIANNFVSQAIGTGSTYMIYDAGTYSEIYYNSVNITGVTSSSYGLYLTSSSAYHDVKNNCVSNTGGGYAMYYSSSTTVNTSNYNNFYATGTNLGYYNGTSYGTLSSWNSGTSLDANSKSVNPYYFTTYDLHTVNSNLNASGTPVTSVSDDIDGESRHASTPDIGADEFTPYANDAGVTDILKPSSSNPSCPGTDSVKVRIYNYGTSTLTSVDVKFKKNYNGTVTTYSLSSISVPSYNTLDVAVGVLTLAKGDSVYAWTENPNSATDGNTSNDLKKVKATLSLTGTYTIGGTTPDYATFTEAVSDLNAAGVCGPVVFYVRSGTYNEQFAFTNIIGASPTNTITFRPDPANSTTPVIYYAGTSSFPYVIMFNGANYITVKKLKIINNSVTGYANVVKFQGNNKYITLDSNIFQGLYSTSTGSNYAVIYDLSGSGNNTEYTNITNNTIKYGSYGIYLYGNSTSQSTYEYLNNISGNLIDSFYQEGLWLYYNRKTTINKNIVRGGPSATTLYGLDLYYCDTLVSVQQNQIIHTRTSSNTSYGVYMYYCRTDLANTHTVANNFVSINGGTGTAYGFYVYYTNYVNFYHNSVVNYAGPSSSTSNVCMYFSTPITNNTIKLRNNLLVNKSSGYCIYTASTATFTSSNYNDFYTNGTILGNWGGTNCNTLSNWQSTSLQDANSMSVDPQFPWVNSPMHFSNAMNFGETGLGITTDIYDTVRVTPTVGAYEYKTPSYDAGISTIVSPSVPFCGSSVIVTLNNYGLQTLTHDTIFWSVNGTAQTPYVWSGTLASGNSTNVTIGTYSFTVSQTYTVKAWVGKVINNTQTDPNIYNDTATAVVTIAQLGMSGIYTIGGSSPDYASFNDAITDLTNKGVCGPTIFYVREGTYNTQITIPQINGASLTNYIVFQPDPANTNPVIINYSATGTGDNWVLRFYEADYVTWKGMKLYALGTTYANVVVFQGLTNYNTVESCYLYGYIGSTTSTSQAVVYHNTSTANKANYNKIKNNVIKYGSYSIYTYGVSSSDMEEANEITGNLIDSFYYYGLYNYYQSNLKINKNTIRGMGAYSTEYGIYAYYCYNALEITQNNVQVRSTSTNYGMYIIQGIGTLSSPGLIANNFISHTGTSTGSNYGIYSSGCTWHKYYHNSINIVVGSAGTTGNTCMYLSGSTNSNNIVKNNILYNGNSICMYLSPIDYVSASDYNCFYATFIGYANSTFYNTISQWRAGTLQDAHSIVEVPGFYSNTDLRHNNNNLNVGVGGLGITVDIFDSARIAPTIGAYEKPSSGYDLSVTQLLSPVKPICSTSQTVKVVIKNLGTYNITSDTIRWEVNGVSQTPVAWTGLLVPGDTEQVVLGTYNINTGSSYTFKVYHSYINGTIADINRGNDTLNVTGIQRGMSGNYTIGGTSPDYPTFTAAVNALIANGVCGPVVFNARNGTYTEQFSIPAISGASATNTITFQSEALDSSKVTIYYDATTQYGQYIVQLFNTSHIILRYLTIWNNSTSGYNRVIDIANGTDSIYILNNRLVGVSTTSSGTGYAVIYSDGSMANYRVQNVTIRYNRIENGSASIYLNGYTNASLNLYTWNNVIEYNVCKDFYYYGIYAYNQRGIKINNNILQSPSAAAYYPIYTYYFYYGCQVNNNTITTTGTTSTGYGIYSYYSYFGNQFNNNTISISGTYYQYGISLYYPYSGNQVNGNDITLTYTGTTTAYYQYGIYLQSMDSAYGSQKSTVLKNNVRLIGNSSYYIYQYGLYYASGWGNSMTYKNLIANNFISLTNNPSGYAYAVYFSSPGYTDFVHNTIHVASSSSSYYAFYVTGVQVTNSVDVVNNNFVNTAAGYCAYYSTNTAIRWMNNNNYYTTGTYLGYWGGARTDLAAWKTATAKDSSAVNYNPNFVSSTNLHASNTNMNNKGVGLSWLVADDIDNESRNASTPDPGADEYNVATLDAGISAIVSPSSAVCPGSVTPTVRIKNYGTATIDSVWVKYKVNYNGTVTSVKVVTTILSNGYYDYAFAGSINMNYGDTLYAWTEDPNNSTDNNTSNDLYKNRILQKLSGTLTIGGVSPTFSSFTEAVTALQTYGVCGPVTFLVRQGTYNEQITIPAISGISSSNTVTFRSDYSNSQMPVLTYAGTGSTNWIVRFNATSYITFKKIKFINTSTIYGTVFNFTGANEYLTLDSNWIEGTGNAASGNWASTNLALLYGTSGNQLHRSNITNNTMKYGSYGVYLMGNSTSDPERTNNFTGNTLDSFYYMGMYFYYHCYLTLDKNTLRSRGVYSTEYGLYLYYCDTSLAITGNNIMLRSTQTNYGIYMNYCRSNSTKAIPVNNNFVSITGGTTSTTYGIYLYYSSYNKLYHNSVNLLAGQANSSASACYYLYGSSSQYNEFVNNIGVHKNQGLALYLYPDNYLSACDYNDYYSNGNYFIYSGTYGYQSSLSQWILNSPWDDHSKDLDPSFYSNTDLRHYSSTMNFGVTGTGVTTDIFGTTRVSPTVGAYEYIQPAYDAGITAILNPVVPLCALTGNVTVTLKNFGSTTLTSDTIRWSINGTAQTPYAWTGSLASGQTANVNIGAYSFTAGNSYTIKAYPSYFNGTQADGNPTNDTSTSAGIRTGLSGTYTIGGSSPDYSSFTEAVNALVTYGVCGNVVFNVRQGTYYEQIEIPAIPGAIQSRSVTFQNDPANTYDAVLTYAPSSSLTNYVLRFNGAKCITIKGLKIQTSSSAYGRVIEFKGNNDSITILNNKIYGSTFLSSSDIYTVIYNYSSGANTCNDITIQGNTIKYGSYAIYWFGDASPYEYRNAFISNTIDSFYTYGIYSYYQYDIKIQRNLIRSRSLITGEYGIYLINSNTSTGSTGSEISRNRIFLKGPGSDYGLYMSSCSGNSSVPFAVFNNYISIYGSNTSSAVNGLAVYSSQFVNIYHNSVNVQAGPSNTTSNAGLYLSGSSNYYNNVKNNIVVNKNSYAIYLSPNDYVASCDYNDLYTNSLYLCNNGTNYTTLSAWQAGSGWDANSVNIDPGFVSNTDLSHSNYSLNRGVTGLGISTDIFDSTRYTPTIGAYELKPIARDAGIIAILSPVHPSCAATADVKVTIKNFGTAALTSDTIRWTVNGVAQTPYAWTGNLSFGDTAQVVIGQYTLSTNTAYNFKVYVSYFNGQYAETQTGNDTAYGNNIYRGMSGTYTIGGTSPDFASFNAAVTALSTQGICGPVVFNVRNGVYTEQVVIPSITGSSATNTITFQSESNDSTKVTLQYSATLSTANYTIKLDGADYIIIRKMTIKALGTTYSRVVDLTNQANYNTFTSNIFIGYYSTNTGDANAVVYSYYTSQSTHCTFNTFTYNVVKYGSYGFRWGGYSPSYSEGNVFNYNLVDSFYYYGMFIYNQKAAKADYNTVRTNNTYINYGIYITQCYYQTEAIGNTVLLDGSSNTKYGIYFTSCYYGPRVNDNQITINSTYVQVGIYLTSCYYNDNMVKPTVLRNKVILKGTTSSSTSVGIYMNSLQGNSSSVEYRWLIANNFVSLYNGTATCYGVQYNSCNNTDFIHNSISIRNGSTSSAALYFNHTTTNTYNYFYNNIASNTGGGYAVYIASSYVPQASDYNNIYATGTYIGYLNGSSYTSFANWQTAVTPFEANSKNYNPSFWSANDLHTWNTQLNAGTPVTYVNTDIDGHSRSTSTPTIGADEIRPAMKYVSSTTTQSVTSNVTPGSSYNQILGIQVVTSGEDSAISASKFSFTTNGTNSPTTNIQNARLYYTGTSNNFSIANQFGNTVSAPNGRFIITGTQELQAGTNYFWLAYDVKSGANIGDTIDAECDTVIVDDTARINTVTAPAGFRKITNDKVLSRIEYVQPSTDDVYRDSNYYPVLRLDFVVNGTTSNLYLDSLEVTAVNTSNSDIDTVRLFRTTTPTFSTAVPVGTGKVLSGGSVKWNSINYDLPGNSTTYLWITYDITSNAVWFNTVDAKIKANSISVNGSLYPTTDQNPTGSRMVNMLPLTLPYSEDFETATTPYTYTASTRPLNGSGLEEWQFESVPAPTDQSRLQMNAGSVYNHTTGGAYAALIDNAVFNSWAVGNLILTLNLSNYVGATDLDISFWYMYQMYRQYSAEDGVWVRGNNDPSTPWVLLYDISANRAGDMTWKNASASISDVLRNAGQSVSGTTQLKFSYKSRYQLGNEAVIFDDINISGTVPVNNDAGVYAITGPTPPYAPGTKSISATIKNYGLNTLTSAKVNWKVNGTAQSQQAWGGSLTSGQTATQSLGNVSVSDGILYTIVANTSEPNATTDNKPANDTATGYICAALSGNYTIGGTSPNFATFSDAAFFLNNCGVRGPVTFNVRAGTYNEQFELGQIPGASSVNTITFKSEDNDTSKVILTYGNSTSSTNYVISLNGTDYITFQYLTIRNTSNSYNRVIYATNSANYVKIKYNHIIGSSTSVNGNNSDVVSFVGTGSGNYCQYDEVQYNTIENGYSGVVMNGYSYPVVYGNKIDYNTIKNFTYQGINVNQQRGISITNNTISSPGVGFYGININQIAYTSDVSYNSINVASYGIYAINCYYGNKFNNNIIDINSSNFKYGIYFSSVYYVNGTTKTQIQNNKIQLQGLNNAYGIYLNYFNGDNNTAANRNLVANNFVSITNSSTSYTHYGIYSYNSHYTDYYYNSVNITTGANNSSALYLYATTSGLYFKNNIFNNSGGGYAVYIPMSSVATITQFDYNNLRTTGSNLVYYNSTNYSSLATWNSASGLDQNSISKNPYFVSNTDLHVKTDTMKAGTPVTSFVTTDIDGATRSTSAPYIGADEGRENDAQLVSVTATPGCPGNYAVYVTLKNNGANYLTKDTIRWSVNGVPKTTYYWTGSLPTDSSITFSIGIHNFTSNENIVAVSYKPNGQNDPDASNDTATATIAPNPNPVAGFSIADDKQCLSGNSFSFTDGSTVSSGSIASWSWTFGNGNTSTSQNPSGISYSLAGTYDVKLVVTTNNGCKDSITKQVTVDPQPVADFSIADDKQCLSGNSYSFTDGSTVSSGSIASWSWTFGNGNTSTSQNPSGITYSAAGTYNVKLVAT
ncbi:MAG TPA: PKD domain-containing protein, partial [Bacteroidia bacterium]|nr:PKD domain-containing protein [Bacteroidia bacterium]